MGKMIKLEFEFDLDEVSKLLLTKDGEPRDYSDEEFQKLIDKGAIKGPDFLLEQGDLELGKSVLYNFLRRFNINKIENKYSSQIVRESSPRINEVKRMNTPKSVTEYNPMDRPIDRDIDTSNLDRGPKG